jgi:hypothetical protein
MKRTALVLGIFLICWSAFGIDIRANWHFSIPFTNVESGYNFDYNDDGEIREAGVKYYNVGEDRLNLQVGYDVLDKFSICGDFSYVNILGKEPTVNNAFSHDFMKTTFFTLGLLAIGKTEIGIFMPYVGAGPMMAISAVTEGRSEYPDPSDPFFGSKISDAYTTTYDPLQSFGFAGVIGVDIMITKFLGLNIGGRFEQLSLRPSKKVLTAREVDGEDVLDDLTTRQKETVYLTSYTEDDISDPSDDEPLIALMNSLSADSFMLFVGLTFKL